ncbi:hypothetical protein BS50DRAFT_231271 [Corynespora cassiicola Philippines]|uniref:Ig-like domain-containing protein n=1 Tax=Corynespora cassiicola Philippines TaxID=1448308 RepID=A0A2T2N1Y9_CORCC|nr:hypothetical protein BS50DRAFT_231271 [Corynespora cassiicola Philippines]
MGPRACARLPLGLTASLHGVGGASVTAMSCISRPVSAADIKTPMIWCRSDSAEELHLSSGAPFDTVETDMSAAPVFGECREMVWFHLIEQCSSILPRLCASVFGRARQFGSSD